MTHRPVERKVFAGTLGAGAGTIVAEFGLWAVDEIWWPGAEEIPSPVAAFVSFVLITGFAFVAGWLAKHDPGYTEEIEYVYDPEETLEVPPNSL